MVIETVKINESLYISPIELYALTGNYHVRNHH